MSEARRCPTCGASFEGPDTHVCTGPGTEPERDAPAAMPLEPAVTQPVTPPTFSRVAKSGDVLEDRYVLLEKVGEGGGGTVFRAHDRDLDVDVAIKVLPPGVLSESVIQRFKREIRITRDIDHPGVSRVFDLGESKGHTFLTMRWIDGEPLHRHIRKQGALGHKRLHRLAAGLVDALAAAHRLGVVHRDVKPGNVLVSAEGAPVLVDFGIAIDLGLSPESTSRMGERLTPVDVIPGTPSFMAPEQHLGRPVTPAADLYSMALTLAFAATGKVGRPDDPVKAFSAFVRPLRRVLVRCLEKEPSRRPRDAVEIQDTLARKVRHRRLLRTGGATAVLVALAVVIARLVGGGSAELPVVHVARLENQTRDPDLDWLGRGVADLVTAGLEASRSVRPALDAKARRDAWRVEGRIRRERGQVVAELDLRSPEGATDARARIDNATGDSLLVGTDRAVTRFLAALGAPSKPMGARAPRQEPVTRDAEAFQHYARARDLVHLHKYHEAAVELRRAIDRDPGFALAHLAMYIIMSYGVTGSLAEHETALAAARRHRDRLPATEREFVDAILDSRERPDSPDKFDRLRTFLRSHRPDSAFYGLAFRAFLPADTQARRSFLEEWAERIPEDGEPHNQLGYLLWLVYERPDAAEREFRTYIRLEPDLANPHDSYCEFLVAQGRPDEAIRNCEKALEIDPEFYRSLLTIVGVHASRGDLARADARVTTARGRIPPDSLDFEMWLASYVSVPLLAGDRQRALDRVEEVASDPAVGSRAYVARQGEAILHALSGDGERAVAAAREADELSRRYHGTRLGGLLTLRPYVAGLAAYVRRDARGLAKAAGEVEALGPRVPPLQRTDWRLQAELLSALLPVVRGDPTSAASRLQALGPGRGLGIPFLAALGRARALVEAGRVTEAREAYEEAIRRGSSPSATIEVATVFRGCLEEAAGLARRTGDDDRASEIESRLASLELPGEPEEEGAGIR